jgi:hypothetical protein
MPDIGDPLFHFQPRASPIANGHVLFHEKCSLERIGKAGGIEPQTRRFSRRIALALPDPILYKRGLIGIVARFSKRVRILGRCLSKHP